MTENQMRSRIKELEAEVESWKGFVEGEKDGREYLIDAKKRLVEFIADVSPAWLPEGMRLRRRQIIEEMKG